MAKFNYRAIAQKIATSVSGKKRIQTAYQKKLVVARALAMQEFDSHPVTREIEGGPGVANSSGTLGGYGDLYSFIGFDQNADPTGNLREVLSEQLVLSEPRNTNAGEHKITFTLKLRIPTEAIRKATPLPWEGGKSWAEGIENGISGFGNYITGLFSNPPSRSGGGIQIRNVVPGREFTPVPYLTEIFNKLIARLQH